MASMDYYLCDICHSKTFYDANLNYGDFGDDLIQNPVTGHAWPFGVGSMIVICEDCAKTHTIKIVEKEADGTT